MEIHVTGGLQAGLFLVMLIALVIAVFGAGCLWGSRERSIEQDDQITRMYWELEDIRATLDAHGDQISIMKTPVHLRNAR